MSIRGYVTFKPTADVLYHQTEDALFLAPKPAPETDTPGELSGDWQDLGYLVEDGDTPASR